MSQEDHLSFSPSLLDIVTYVHPKDILSCQLVSHRFHGVIKKNRHLMRRPMAKMRIYSFKIRLAYGLVVCVSAEEYPYCKIFVDERGTTIQYGGLQSSMVRHFSDNGIALDDTEFPGVPESAIHPLFRTNDTHQGALLIFQYWFNKYHFSSIEIIGTEGGQAEYTDWSSIICEEFRRCGSRCYDLHLSRLHWSDIQPFYSQLERVYTWLRVEREIDLLLASISHWNRQLTIVVEPESFKNFRTITEFIKCWEIGKNQMIKSIKFHQKRRHGSFPWTSSDVVDMLRCMQCVKVANTRDSVHIHIKRRIDNRILVVKYSREARILILEEVVGYTELDDQQRINYNHPTYKKVKNFK